MLVPKCALSQFANWDLFIPVWKLGSQAQSQFANWDRSRNNEYFARMISPLLLLASFFNLQIQDVMHSATCIVDRSTSTCTK